jgi:thioredoxin:protein disulfide reductase
MTKITSMTAHGSRILSLLAAILSIYLCAEAAAPLEPEQAFKPTSRAVTKNDGQAIEITYAVTKGYYMYKDKFKFSLAPTGAALGSAQFPIGIDIDDPNFGKTEVFRNKLVISIPVTVTENGPYRLNITAQGCADQGFCYPPFKQGATIEFPGQPVDIPVKTKQIKRAAKANPL